ncbi:MAG: TIGR02530 family flagellar biosynthesis protein [candidate division Zixibacteria bacterium]
MLKVTAYQNVNLPDKTIRPAGPIQPAGKANGTGTKVNFKSTLDEVVQKNANINFSAHARARLHSRGVVLDDAMLNALSQAIDKAEAKGARESLVLSNDAAYVVSVTNRTVITAFDKDNLRDGVFTAIDSAIIL